MELSNLTSASPTQLALDDKVTHPINSEQTSVEQTSLKHTGSEQTSVEQTSLKHTGLEQTGLEQTPLESAQSSNESVTQEQMTKENVVQEPDGNLDRVEVQNMGQAEVKQASVMLSLASANSGVMSDKVMLVLGATSDMAIATMQLLAKEGWGFHLAGRDVSKLESLAQDLSVRCGYKVTYSKFDTEMSVGEQMDFWQDLIKVTTPENKPVSSLAGLLCAIGYLGQYDEDQQHKLNMHQQVLRSNFGGLIPVLEMAADYFEQKHSGKIIVISSVAGDRGRASNYPYGSAKAALSAYLSGLRARLFNQNVHVMTVLPGFVRTKMIAHLQTNPKITASPEQVAQDIVKGMHKNSSIVYTKRMWRYIMLIVKHIPEFVFKRLSKI